MKYVLVSLLLISSTLSAQTGIEIFGKYKIPDVEYSVFSLNLNSFGNSNSNNDPIASVTTYYGVQIPTELYSQKERSSLNFLLQPVYNKINENEKFQHQLLIGSPISFSYNESDHAEILDEDFKRNQGPYNSISRVASLLPIITYSSLNYRDETSSFFTYFQLHSDLNFQFNRSNSGSGFPLSNFELRSFSNNYSDRKSQNYEFEIGLGSGRMRDVTSIITALRFEERLKQVNLLSESFSDDQVSSIAQKFSLSSYYNSVYDRSSKYFWDDMQKKLDEYDVNLSQSTLHSQLYVIESLNELKFRRVEGSKLSAGLVFKFMKTATREFSSSDSYQFPYQTPDYTVHITESNSEAILPGLKLGVQSSKQLSLYSQLGVRFQIESHVNASEHKNNLNYHLLNGSFNFNHEITDRFVYSVSNSLEFSNTNFDHASLNVLSNVFANELTLFIEDQIGLQFDYNFSYRETTRDFEIKRDFYYRDHTFSLGLTYFFNKSLLIN